MGISYFDMDRAKVKSAHTDENMYIKSFNYHFVILILDLPNLQHQQVRVSLALKEFVPVDSCEMLHEKHHIS